MYFSKKDPLDKNVNTEDQQQNSKTFVLEKIISGGQTGADRGGLEAAETLGIETGGTVPIGFWTTEGKCPDLGVRFKLKELSVERGAKLSISDMYIERSKKNVDESDATIAFRLHSSVGTDKTIGYCLTKTWNVINYQNYTNIPYRLLLVIDDVSERKKKQNIANIQTFMVKNSVKILNVCGHREGKETGCENFTVVVRNLLIAAFLPFVGF